MLRNLLTLSLLVATTLSLNAQDFFSSDPEKFLKDLTKFMEKADGPKSKVLFEAFEPAWNSAYYNQDYRESLIKTCNMMYAGKLRPFPDYENYLTAQIALASSNATAKRYTTWHDALHGTLGRKSKKRDAQRFLEFSKYLFADDILYRSNSGNVIWKADNDSYVIHAGKTPYISFDTLSLICDAKRDKSRILRTSGAFYPTIYEWEGEGGKVTWERAKFEEDEIYALLGDYKIDMRQPAYEADSVAFVNKKYFPTPIMGRLTEKIIADVKASRVSYPRFDSYNDRFVIEDIIDGVDYEGGFSQHGIRFLGAGSPEFPAKIVIYKDTKPFMTASAPRFTIRLNDEPIEEEETGRRRRKDEEVKKQDRNRIVSSSARIKIQLEQDSIVHPGLVFTLYTDDRLVNLVRNDDGMAKSPYFNSYHNIEMKFELLEWKIDEPLMQFKSYPLSTEKTATFTSINFYKEQIFDAIQGISSWHPLSYLNLCANRFGSNELTSSQIADCIGIPITQVEPMLLRYSYDGFVEYDVETHMCKILPKTKHFVESKSEKSDYDVINVTSLADGSTKDINASLSLLNFDLDIRGVDRITLSDSHKVEIYPAGREIVMKKNRDFDFNGMINSGKVEFFGKNFSFGYDAFEIDMPVVDSMQIWASTSQTDEQGFLLEARVRTVIQDLSGDMKIDRNDNKSGVKPLSQYPIFTCTKESYAYYNQKEVLGGVYPKERFYFKLVPFEFDSLDNFINENIQFGGTFVSAGIFPDMEEKLVLQEDYSLGFTHQTPPGGYPAYGGAGTYENDIDLSNKGLRGDGLLRYITSTTQSEEMFFFPDSMNTITTQFDIEEQMAPVEYANVSAGRTFVHWEPYTDFMEIESIKGEEPINMFAGVSKHTGILHYDHSALTGSGVNRFEGASLYSDLMEFKFFELLADTSDFELNVEDLFDAIDFSSENVKAEVNFKERFGNFTSNTGGSLTTFDIIQYQAWLDRFTWFMDSEEVEFSADGEVVESGTEDLKLEGARFTSIHPKQDSLNWNAKAATYSLREKKIIARDVPFIDVADARVFPNNGFVTVHKNANMQPLKESKVVANRQLMYHTIYESTIKIEGKWDYGGSGLYDYEDMNGLVQTLNVEDIMVDTTRQTYATGEISMDDDFSLSPHFSYKGAFTIHANRKPLTFDGYGRIHHDCKNIRLSWFSFESEVDPEDVQIEITDPAYNGGGEEIRTSMMIPLDSNLLYSAFLSKPESKQDVAITPTAGLVTYDIISKEYQISTFEKLTERTLPGNYIGLKTKTCVVESEGILNLVDDVSHLEVKPAGNFTYNTISNENDMEAIMTMDFMVDNSIMNVMVKELQEMESLEAVDFDREVFEIGLRDLAGQKMADDMLSRMDLGKRVTMPEELQKTFFFNQLNMTYNPKTESFVSDGQIGIGNIGKNQINRLVDGKVEFKNNRRSTDITVYLELTPSKWYIFSFKGSSGIMKLYSTNGDFMSAVMGVKPDKRRIKAEKGNRGYQYMNGSKNDRTRFLSKFDE